MPWWVYLALFAAAGAVQVVRQRNWTPAQRETEEKRIVTTQNDARTWTGALLFFPVGLFALIFGLLGLAHGHWESGALGSALGICALIWGVQDVRVVARQARDWDKW